MIQWSGRQRNVLKSVMHVQSCCFADKTNGFLMLSLLSFKSYIQSFVVLLKTTNYEVFYQGIANLFVLISSSSSSYLS